MTTTKAVSCDVKKLYALENELFTAENFPLSKGSLYYHIRHNMLYTVKTDSGDVIAYCLALIHRKDAKIYSLGVAKAYRGGNIACELMKNISKELMDLGFKRCVLEVRTDNEPAIALYKKLGFSIQKTIKNFYIDGCDAYFMEINYGDKKLY